MASSSSSSCSCTQSKPPCAACKFLRRKCQAGCIFAPYFSPEEPFKFLNVHKIFGASNVSKLLQEIPPQHREDAVNSLAYEAEARLQDPVYGCVGAISLLQRQVLSLQKQLDATNADLRHYTTPNLHPTDAIMTTFHVLHDHRCCEGGSIATAQGAVCAAAHSFFDPTSGSFHPCTCSDQWQRPSRADNNT